MTTRARVTFVPKQYGNGDPWLALEPLDGQLSGQGLPTGLFGLELPEGTSYDKAREIAAYLNENVENLTFTKF